MNKTVKSRRLNLGGRGRFWATVLAPFVITASMWFLTSGADTASAAATGTPLKFGLVSTNSGPLSLLSFVQAEKAYVANWNAHGGYKGHPIDLIDIDGDLNPQQTADAARSLVSQDQVIGMAGDAAVLDCSVNNSFYQSANIAVLGGGAPGCFIKGTDFPEIRESGSGGASALLKFAVSKGAKKLAFVAPSVTGLASVSDALRAYLRTQSGTSLDILMSLPIVPTAADIDEVLAQLKASGVKGVFFIAVSPSTAALALQQAILMSYGPNNGIIWMMDGMGLFAPGAAQATNGSYLITNGYPWTDDNPQVKAALRILKGKVSNLDALAQQGYQVADLFHQALDRVKGPVTRASFKRALESMTNVPLALTPVRVNLFNPSHNPIGAGIVQSKGGKFVTVAPYVVTNY